jgi:hypothetical protein
MDSGVMFAIDAASVELFSNLCAFRDLQLYLEAQWDDGALVFAAWADTKGQ